MVVAPVIFCTVALGVAHMRDLSKFGRVGGKLVQLAHGKHPVALFEPLSSGFWLGVHIDRACSLTQQYHP